jgi:hypothetical protein
MRDVTFTVYRNAQDTAGRPVTQPWDEWLKQFATHDVRGKPEDTTDKAALDRAKNGPAIVLGVIPAGEPRRGVNVQEVHALALDLENETEEQLEPVFEALAAYEWFVYTTHKHGSQAANGYPRLRVLLPLASPLQPSEHANAWARLDQLIGGFNDPSTKDIGRLHYLPSTFDASKAWVHHHSGKWLQFEDLQNQLQSQPQSQPPRKALERLRKQLGLVSRADELKPLTSALLKGIPFADSGGRHQAVLSLTMWIAERNADLDLTALQSLFGQSLEAMKAAAPEAPTIDEVVTAYKGAVDKLGVKEEKNNTERAQQARAAQLEAVAATGPYADADLEKIATTNGWSPADLKNRWVIQKGSAVWLLDENGDYCGPYLKDEWGTATSRILARAPVRLTDVTRNGVKWRAMSDVFRECGSVARTVVADMTLRRTTYNPVTQVLCEAVSPIRDIEPKFDPEIDEWLKLLGGVYYSKLVDWMSCASDLNKMLCGIYFDGSTLSGKTLLAHGMAKIWTEGAPTMIKAALSDFNSDIARCPVVLADEEIPKPYNSTVTAILRSMLSVTSRTLTRKYLASSDINGAIRLVLTANNEFLLDTKDVSSHQDLEAIAQRFLRITVTEAAAPYLETIGRAKMTQWKNNGIAAHALWLAENHEVKDPGKRFWVEGDVARMHSNLLLGSKWNSTVCEWLVRYLMNRKPFDTKGTGLIKCEGGQLFVNDQAIIDGWNLYLNTKQEAETAKIGAALRAISKSAERRQMRFNGRQIRYRPIDIEHLFAWSDRYNIGSRESLLEAINTND